MLHDHDYSTEKLKKTQNIKNSDPKLSSEARVAVRRLSNEDITTLMTDMERRRSARLERSQRTKHPELDHKVMETIDVDDDSSDNEYRVVDAELLRLLKEEPSDDEFQWGKCFTLDDEQDKDEPSSSDDDTELGKSDPVAPVSLKKTNSKRFLPDSSSDSEEEKQENKKKKSNTSRELKLLLDDKNPETVEPTDVSKKSQGPKINIKHRDKQAMIYAPKKPTASTSKSSMPTTMSMPCLESMESNNSVPYQNQRQTEPSIPPIRMELVYATDKQPQYGSAEVNIPKTRKKPVRRVFVESSTQTEDGFLNRGCCKCREDDNRQNEHYVQLTNTVIQNLFSLMQQQQQHQPMLMSNNMFWQQFMQSSGGQALNGGQIPNAITDQFMQFLGRQQNTAPLQHNSNERQAVVYNVKSKPRQDPSTSDSAAKEIDAVIASLDDDSQLSQVNHEPDFDDLLSALSPPSTSNNRSTKDSFSIDHIGNGDPKSLIPGGSFESKQLTKKQDKWALGRFKENYDFPNKKLDIISKEEMAAINQQKFEELADKMKIPCDPEPEPEILEPFMFNDFNVDDNVSEPDAAFSDNESDADDEPVQTAQAENQLEQSLDYGPQEDDRMDIDIPEGILHINDSDDEDELHDTEVQEHQDTVVRSFKSIPMRKPLEEDEISLCPSEDLDFVPEADLKAQDEKIKAFKFVVKNDNYVPPESKAKEQVDNQPLSSLDTASNSENNSNVANDTQPQVTTAAKSGPESEVTPKKTTTVPAENTKDIPDDLGWGDKNGIINIGSSTEKDTSMERRSILDYHDPEPPANPNRFKRKSPKSGVKNNRYQNFNINNSYADTPMAMQRNCRPLAPFENRNKNQNYPPPLMPPPALPPALLFEVEKVDFDQVMEERVDFNQFMVELLSDYCHNFLVYGTCGFGGGCPMTCSTQLEQINREELRNILKTFDNNDLTKFFEVCCQYFVLFNVCFPELADVLGTKNLVQLLLLAVNVCEQPQYFTEHFKWIVHGLIRANITPEKAIEMLLNKVKDLTLEAKQIIVDIIIKSRVHVHYYEFIFDCIHDPDFLIHARRVDELILTTIELRDKKWLALTQQVIINCMTDESVRDLVHLEKYKNFVDELAKELIEKEKEAEQRKNSNLVEPAEA